jgi:hypothetical protein
MRRKWLQRAGVALSLIMLLAATPVYADPMESSSGTVQEIVTTSPETSGETTESTETEDSELSSSLESSLEETDETQDSEEDFDEQEAPSQVDLTADEEESLLVSEETVASIGEQEFESFDEAVEAAKKMPDETVTITLYKDAQTDAGLNLSRNLVIQGDTSSGTVPVLTFTNYGIALWGKTLTINDCQLILNGIGSTPYGEWGWMTICTSNNSELALNRASMTLKGSESADSKLNKHAIYCSGNTRIALDASKLVVENYVQDALEWDGGSAASYNLVMTNGSEFLSDHCRSGLTGTFTAKVTDSTMKVLNSSGNGSNGSHFEFTNSTVDFTGNGSHGLSAGKLSIINSDVTCNDNVYHGITANTSIYVDKDSNVQVHRNNAKTLSGSYGAVRITGSGSTAVVEQGATFDVTENYQSGVQINNGSKMELNAGLITKNGSQAEKGGGVYNRAGGTFTMAAGVQVYDNSANTAGADLYNEGADSTMTFQTIDGMTNGGDDLVLTNTGDGSTATITDWFYDGVNAGYSGMMTDGATHRWEKDIYMKRYLGGYESITGETALKAAFAAQTEIEPIHLVIYQGGEGYEGTEGFPEPGYTVVLPDTVNEALNGKVDLVEDEDIQVRYYYKASDETRVWHMERYAGGDSTLSDGRYVYSLYCETDSNAYPKLLIQDENGNTWTNDNFPVTNSIYEEFTTSITSSDNGAELGDNFTASVQLSTIDVDCDVTVNKGTLEVRGVMEKDGETTFTAVADENAVPTAGEPMATAPEGTEYYINGEDGLPVVVQDALPTLLYDDMLTAGDGNEERLDWLKDKADEVCEANGYLEEAGIEDPEYLYKYMDLVDAKNGNVVLTSSQPVTVYMPLPEGTDEDTSFVLLHYEGVDRNMEADELESVIAQANVVKMDITVSDDHLSFTTDNFSPFVLMWDGSKDDGTGTGTGTDKPEKPAGSGSPQTGDTTNLPLWIALLGASGIGLMGTLAVSKKRTRRNKH